MQDTDYLTRQGNGRQPTDDGPCTTVVSLFSVSTKLVQKTSKDNSRCMCRGSWWWKLRQRKKAVRISKKETRKKQLRHPIKMIEHLYRYFFFFIGGWYSDFPLNSSSETGSLSDDSDDWERASSDDLSNIWLTDCLIICGNYAVTLYLPLTRCLIFPSRHDHISILHE